MFLGASLARAKSTRDGFANSNAAPILLPIPERIGRGSMEAASDCAAEKHEDES
jgi:hypothetical protein